MKPRPYGPFPYSPIISRPRLEWPNGAHVALWIIPNIEYFSLQERPGGYGPGGKIPDVVMWSRARLRQPRRRIPDHGDARPLRHARHGRAQQQPVRRASRDHRRGRKAQVGVDGPQRKQHPPPQRSAARARRRRSSAARSTPSARRPAGVRSAGSPPACSRPGIRSTISRPKASNTSPTGATTTSPTR